MYNNKSILIISGTGLVGHTFAPLALYAESMGRGRTVERQCLRDSPAMWIANGVLGTCRESGREARHGLKLVLVKVMMFNGSANLGKRFNF